MLRPIQFTVGLVLLLALEVLRVYFIMPFPGSQTGDTLEFAYFLNINIFYFRAIGLLIIIFPVIHYYMFGSTRKKVLVTLGMVLYVFIFYLCNYKFAADEMFKEPEKKTFAKVSEQNVIKPDQLILGVSLEGKAKAYPIEIIGYHHQIRDTLSGQPLMITYCTVCRTGRIFNPIVNGKAEQFRLVGMDHFNAMFEDATTGSWWRQVNGEAVIGPLKGTTLNEIPASQMSLRAWLDQHPDSEILQPDTVFNGKYDKLLAFDEGETESPLLKRDSLSWNEKSWILGVQIGMHARAYDWNDLLRLRVVNDTLGNVPIVVAIENDSTSFHVWRRDSLTFRLHLDSLLTDDQTSSIWNWHGKSIEGPMSTKKLPVIQSYQEFWHSWRTFRPQSTRYEIN